MEQIFQTIRRIAAVAAFAAAVEMFLPEGTAKKGVDLLVSLAMALAVAGFLPGIFGSA